MLINEARLRELYAAGEIDVDHLERSLDIINKRREAAEREKPSGRAGAPLPLAQREQMLDAIADAQIAASRTRRPLGPPCPTCHSELREVVEYGVRTHWCQGCQTYAGVDPRDVPAASPGRGGIIVAGAYVECGPDADGDGDVDGGLFDLFG